MEEQTIPEEEPAPTQTVIHSCHRTGCMAAFESFNQFESYFEEILELVEEFSSTSAVSPKIIEAVDNVSESQSTSINVSLSVDGPIRSQDDEHNVQVIFHFSYLCIFFISFKYI